MRAQRRRLYPPDIPAARTETVGIELARCATIDGARVGTLPLTILECFGERRK
jgi:hypothetical protein